MKNSKRAVIISGLLISVLVPLAALGAEFRTGDQPHLDTGEVAAGNLYLAGGNVTSAGNVRGDLTAAGGTVLVNGPVGGDLLAGGGSLTVIGNVAGDLRFGGGNVLIQGAVAGDVTGAGGQITLSGAQVGGDVTLGGGSIILDAPVTGDLRLGGGEVRINAPIAGDVTVLADKLTLGPRAVIAGSLTYTAAKMATLETGAVVRGETVFNQRLTAQRTKTAGAAFFSFWLLIKSLMALAGALLIGLVFSRYSRELVAKAAAQPWVQIGRGLLFLIVVPILSVILLATIIGLPLGLLGLLAYALCLLVACLTAPIILGSLLHQWIWKPAEFRINWKTILLGGLAGFILSLIPFIGWLIKLVLLLLALGSTLRIKWEVIKHWT